MKGDSAVGVCSNVVRDTTMCTPQEGGTWKGEAARGSIRFGGI